MIAESSEKITKEKLEKYTDIIQKSTDFSIEILNALASLNRLKSPKFKLDYQNSNYCEVLTNVVNKFKTETDNTNISIEMNVPKNTVFLSFDINEITHVIDNILSNAMRFSSNNSTVSIAVIETEKTVETIITDNGIGISEADLPHVFDEFWVVNTYSENNNKCVGLGLAIAKIIVNYHNGEIKASSSFGKGTAFSFTLPKV